MLHSFNMLFLDSCLYAQPKLVRLWNEPSSGDSVSPWTKNKPHLVVMTIISTICSHTMRQKSTKVFGKGPEGCKVASGHSNT